MNRQQFAAKFLLHQMHKKPLNQASNLTTAAVLIPFIQREQQLFMILTQRSHQLRHHPGQISFPGGRFEASDQHLSHTALRETQEEIGLAMENIKILGQMGVYHTISRYQVTPFIGFVNNEQPYSINHNEVETVFEVPWTFLLNSANHYKETIPGKNTHYESYFIPYEGKMIWGTTALIIHDLSIHFSKPAVSAKPLKPVGDHFANL